MTKKILLYSASALMFCVSGDALAERPALPVTHAHGEVHRIIAAVPGSVTLYDQNNDDSEVAIPSENFTHDFESYDSSGADDFTVPVGHTWKVREVEVTGVYGQSSNPADSENVFFYKGRRGLPQDLVAECDSIKEPIRKELSHVEGFAARRRSMMRIMARRMKAVAVLA